MFVVPPLGGSLYSTCSFRAEYKLPPKGRTTNPTRRFGKSLLIAAAAFQKKFACMPMHAGDFCSCDAVTISAPEKNSKLSTPGSDYGPTLPITDSERPTPEGCPLPSRRYEKKSSFWCIVQ